MGKAVSFTFIFCIFTYPYTYPNQNKASEGPDILCEIYYIGMVKHVLLFQVEVVFTINEDDLRKKKSRENICN